MNKALLAVLAMLLTSVCFGQDVEAHIVVDRSEPVKGTSNHGYVALVHTLQGPYMSSNPSGWEYPITCETTHPDCQELVKGHVYGVHVLPKASAYPLNDKIISNMVVYGARKFFSPFPNDFTPSKVVYAVGESFKTK
jgi:hypothetical protein